MNDKEKSWETGSRTELIGDDKYDSEHYHNLHFSFSLKTIFEMIILKCSCSWKFECYERQFAENIHLRRQDFGYDYIS